VSAAESADNRRKALISLSPVGILSGLAGLFGGGAAGIIVALALLGTPLFAIMGAASELAWLLHKDASYHHLRFIAPNVLDDRFAGSPVLVTIPLFTFVGYLLAESRTADRIIRFSTALLGWLPGGLALVCIVASSFFTAITGGSGATIIAVGGLLYPALRKQGYSPQFALGLITTGGSAGLFFPPSLPVLVYSLVAGIDFTRAYKVGIVPGLLVIGLLAAYSISVGARQKIKTTAQWGDLWPSFWDLKWEAFIPVIIMGGLLTGMTALDESAGLAALYTLLIEVLVYKDLKWKDLPRLTKSAVTLAGALIIVLAMANALMNYVIQEQIPGKVLEQLLRLGLTHTWQFLLMMNAFLLVLGMIMEGFSAIIVAVPLILPFAAQFRLNPFHLAMMFILNLEVAYVCPPLGLNLFISGFRFNRPVVTLYKTVPPFVGLLAIALLMVSYVPKLSTMPIEGDIRQARAEAAESNLPPRQAWLLECVQEDRTNVKPCSAEDEKKWGDKAEPKEDKLVPEAPTTPADAGPSGGPSDDDIMKMLQGGTGATGSGVGAAGDAGAKPSTGPSDDEIMKMLQGGVPSTPSAAPSAPPAPTGKSGGMPSDEEIERMLRGGKP
jgi:tripartite ATP-independent transporter DctM subunit